MLTKKYLTGIELKRAFLIASAIALVFYVRTRIRYASQKVPDIYDVKARSNINELLKQDSYVRTDTDAVSYTHLVAVVVALMSGQMIRRWQLIVFIVIIRLFWRRG